MSGLRVTFFLNDFSSDAEVGQCRECGTQFTVVVRRHHCRGCGGIYCENCLANTITINEASERGCGGCFIGATPGETIKELAKTLSSTQESSATQAIPFRLSHGKLFGDGKVSGGPSTAPTAGYFELVTSVLVDISENIVFTNLFFGKFMTLAADQ